MDVAAITNQIEDLIRAHAALTARAQYADLSDLKDESAELVVRLQAAVDRIVPSSTTYAKEARRTVTLLRTYESRHCLVSSRR